MVALADSNNKLLVKTSDLESRSHRSNIQIIGLPESIEGPTPTMFFSKLLVELLREEILESPPKLDRAHRTLTAKSQPGLKPRPVIIRLHRYQIKDLIIREARKRRGKLQYQGTPVQIFEDYAPEVVEECAKYRTVMAAGDVQPPGNTQRWDKEEVFLPRRGHGVRFKLQTEPEPEAWLA